jgi:hypothetical protein
MAAINSVLIKDLVKRVVRRQSLNSIQTGKMPSRYGMRLLPDGVSIPGACAIDRSPNFGTARAEIPKFLVVEGMRDTALSGPPMTRRCEWNHALKTCRQGG